VRCRARTVVGATALSVSGGDPPVRDVVVVYLGKQDVVGRQVDIDILQGSAVRIGGSRIGGLRTGALRVDACERQPSDGLYYTRQIFLVQRAFLAIPVLPLQGANFRRGYR